MFTVYVPAVNVFISSVAAPLLQSNVKGAVPPVTVRFNEPVLSPKQSTLVTAIPDVNTFGWFTVVLAIAVHCVTESVTSTE